MMNGDPIDAKAGKTKQSGAEYPYLGQELAAEIRSQVRQQQTTFISCNK
jgi:hypothetical protein